jgi:hypothetical protein
VQTSLIEHVQRRVQAIKTGAAVAGAVSLITLVTVFRMARKTRAAYTSLGDAV